MTWKAYFLEPAKEKERWFVLCQTIHPNGVVNVDFGLSLKELEELGSLGETGTGMSYPSFTLCDATRILKRKMVEVVRSCSEGDDLPTVFSRD